jgi:hypothetical protein
MELDILNIKVKWVKTEKVVSMYPSMSYFHYFQNYLQKNFSDFKSI